MLTMKEIIGCLEINDKINIRLSISRLMTDQMAAG